MGFNADKFINFSGKVKRKRDEFVGGIAGWIGEQLQLLGFSEKQILDNVMFSEIAKEAERIAKELDKELDYECLEVARILAKKLSFDEFDTIVKLLPFVEPKFLDKLHMSVLKAAARIEEKFKDS